MKRLYGNIEELKEVGDLIDAILTADLYASSPADKRSDIKPIENHCPIGHDPVTGGLYIAVDDDMIVDSLPVNYQERFIDV